MSRTTGMVADPLGIITRESTEIKTKLADHLIVAVVIMVQKLMMIQLLVQHSTPCHSNLHFFVGCQHRPQANLNTLPDRVFLLTGDFQVTDHQIMAMSSAATTIDVMGSSRPKKDQSSTSSLRWQSPHPSQHHYLHQQYRQYNLGKVQAMHGDFGFKTPLDPHDRFLNRTLDGGVTLDVGCYLVELALLAAYDHQILISH